MRKKKIAISGIGGGAGQSAIKALYDTNYHIVGLDGNSDGTGLYAVPSSYQIPYASQDNYIEDLIAVLKKEECILMFPGLDAELEKLALNKNKIFDQTGTIVIVSNPSVIKIADNKLLTAKFLASIDLPSPLTYNLSELIEDQKLLDFPYIVKPKTGGARSKNVYKIENELQINQLVSSYQFHPEEYVAQEYIDGHEYTCGTISFQGKYFGSIIMRRILRDGDTYKCFVEFNPIIEEVLRKVILHLKPFGLMNIQLRIRNNKAYIFEMNARCSGTTAARAISGFNGPKSVADYILFRKKPVFKIKKTNIFRYWKEFVVEENQLSSIQNEGHYKNTDFQKL